MQFLFSLRVGSFCNFRKDVNRFTERGMKKKEERKKNQRDTSTSSTADWSELPNELLYLISERIDNEIDLIRFRSVCSNWRSSSIPNHHLQISPIKFPLVHDSLNNTNSPLCYLSKRTLFLVKPPPHGKTLIRGRPWLIRVTQNSHGKTKFFNPFISYRRPQEQTPIHPHVLDFNKLSILYLGTDFIDEDNLTFQIQRGRNLHPETVLAVMCHGNNPLLLGTLSHYSNRPLIFRGRDEQWKLISNRSSLYGDICLFKGRFYVVDQSGETVAVGPDSSIELAAQPLGPGSPGWNKMLVENEGRLLLLAIDQKFYCFSIDFFELDEKEKKWVRLMDFDEKEKKWVKLRNFGDRIFFIGRGCSFSASASDLCIPKGNCVVFIDESVLCIGNMVHRKRVFHLDQNQLSCGAKYLKLFLPLKWIHNI